MIISPAEKLLWPIFSTFLQRVLHRSCRSWWRIATKRQTPVRLSPTESLRIPGESLTICFCTSSLTVSTLRLLGRHSVLLFLLRASPSFLRLPDAVDISGQCDNSLCSPPLPKSLSAYFDCIARHPDHRKGESARIVFERRRRNRRCGPGAQARGSLGL